MQRRIQPLVGKIAVLFMVLAMVVTAVPVAWAGDAGSPGEIMAADRGELDIAQTMRPSSLLPGSQVIFDFSINSTGRKDAVNIDFTYTIDPTLAIDGITVSHGRVGQGTANELKASLGTLPPRRQATVTIFAHVKPQATAGTQIYSAAKVSWVIADRERMQKAANTLILTVSGPTDPGSPAPQPEPVLGPFDRIPAFTSTATRWYFEQTGHSLSSGFLAFWLQNNGEKVFGLPLSEEMTENGRAVQYFERAKFEFWPENPIRYSVLVSDLGRQMYESTPAVPGGPNTVGHMYFSQTGHWIHSLFLDYWQENGGLDVFGMPIREQEEVDGRLVQIFERARFEYHPENAGTPFEVQLGLIGREQLSSQGLVQ